MLDVDTFLTTLYLIVDNFCQSLVPGERLAAGPEASLSSSEVVTLAIFARSGLASQANGISTATLKRICGKPSLLCPIARSSTARCATVWISSKP